MPALALEPRQLDLCQLLGPDAPALVEAAGLPLPDVMCVATTDKGFIARTGRDEFLVHAGGIQPADGAQCWRYPRADRVLALQGESWRAAMAQVCHKDFTAFGAGDWVMVAAAGISIWCLGLADGLLLGCDPSLGACLQQTLGEVVRDLNATLSSDQGDRP